MRLDSFTLKCERALNAEVNNIAALQSATESTTSSGTMHRLSDALASPVSYQKSPKMFCRESVTKAIHLMTRLSFQLLTCVFPQAWTPSSRLSVCECLQIQIRRFQAANRRDPFFLESWQNILQAHRNQLITYLLKL